MEGEIAPLAKKLRSPGRKRGSSTLKSFPSSTVTYLGNRSAAAFRIRVAAKKETHPLKQARATRHEDIRHIRRTINPFELPSHDPYRHRRGSNRTAPRPECSPPRSFVNAPGRSVRSTFIFPRSFGATGRRCTRYAGRRFLHPVRFSAEKRCVYLLKPRPPPSH